MATKKKLSHFNKAGRAKMVDVSAKPATRREAVAEAFVELSPKVLAALPKNPKGDALEISRFAGVQAAKKTAELIPMCHPLPLSFVDVEMKLTAKACRSAQPPQLPHNRRRDGGDDGSERRRTDDL